ncbi:MAG: hypothetical protein FWK04_22570 [Nostoc sp. GBBB01]|nr:hypothetical protein [Nostoc sp. GBBB01]
MSSRCIGVVTVDWAWGIGHWALGIGQKRWRGRGEKLISPAPQLPISPYFSARGCANGSAQYKSPHLPYSLLKCLRINEQTSVGSMMSLSTR